MFTFLTHNQKFEVRFKHMRLAKDSHGRYTRCTRCVIRPVFDKPEWLTRPEFVGEVYFDALSPFARSSARKEAFALALDELGDLWDLWYLAPLHMPFERLERRPIWETYFVHFPYTGMKVRAEWVDLLEQSLRENKTGEDHG